MVLISQFAIRINMRNHTRLKRDEAINIIASVVGPNHKVDLKDYDLLILVEIFQVRADALLDDFSHHFLECLWLERSWKRI
jgi:hypothetical protein